MERTQTIIDILIIILIITILFSYSYMIQETRIEELKIENIKLKNIIINLSEEKKQNNCSIIVKLDDYNITKYYYKKID